MPNQPSLIGSEINKARARFNSTKRTYKMLYNQLQAIEEKLNLDNVFETLSNRLDSLLNDTLADDCEEPERTIDTD